MLGWACKTGTLEPTCECYLAPQLDHGYVVDDLLRVVLLVADAVVADVRHAALLLGLQHVAHAQEHGPARGATRIHIIACRHGTTILF